MTGREAAEYILINRHDESEIVIYIDGQRIPVYDIVYEMSGGELVVLPDCRQEDKGGSTMTLKDLVQNLIENDRTGDYYDREITVDEAAQFIGYLDDETIDAVSDEVTPEAFSAVWNEIVKG